MKVDKSLEFYRNKEKVEFELHKILRAFEMRPFLHRLSELKRGTVNEKYSTGSVS